MNNFIFNRADHIEIYSDGSVRVGKYSQPAKEPASRPRLVKSAPLPKWVREELSKGNVVLVTRIDVAENSDGGVYPIVRGKAVTPSVETEKKLYGTTVCFDSEAQLIKAYRQFCLITVKTISSGQVIDRKENSGSEVIATRDYAEFLEFRNANDRVIERIEKDPEVKTEVNYFSTSDETTFVRRETTKSTPQWTERRIDSRYIFNEETGEIDFVAAEVEVSKIGTTTTTATLTTVKVLEKKESHRSYKLGCYADTTEYVFDNGEKFSSTESFVPWVEEQTRLAQYQEDFRNGVLDD